MSLSLGVNGNTVSVTGAIAQADFLRVQAAIHNLVSKQGYQDIVLDMSACTRAYAGPMLALCSFLVHMRTAGVDVSLVPPTNKVLRSLFVNTGWANLIDPQSQPESTFKSRNNMPATSFRSASEQQAAVNRFLDAALSAMDDFRREDLEALEWTINELTDNVLLHSECTEGGIVQLTQYPTQRRIEYVVSDAGIGIPKTIRVGHPELRSDAEALDSAIREGVTGGKGMGNGLFGSYQIASISGGSFKICSSRGRLDFDPDHGLSVYTQQVPLNGTLIIGSINLDRPDLLSKALRFNGKPYEPTDYVELKYEDESRRIVFKMIDECASYGSRSSAIPIRTKLRNLLAASVTKVVVVDMSTVPLLSSSFADEVFGKLASELGLLTFMSRFQMIGLAESAHKLIERAISQRLAGLATEEE